MIRGQVWKWLRREDGTDRSFPLKRGRTGLSEREPWLVCAGENAEWVRGGSIRDGIYVVYLKRVVWGYA